MTISVSDNAVLIGVIAIGVFFGVSYVPDAFNINVESGSIILDILVLTYYVGLLLLVSGAIYKILKWRSSHKG